MLDGGIFKVIPCKKWAIGDSCYCATLRKNKFKHKTREMREILGQILAVQFRRVFGRQE